jgi:hypothetical protein
VPRFSGRPPGYAPGLEIELRTQPEGGAVRRPAQLQGASPLLPRARCTVLIHGYNNHEGEAAAAYLGFREREYALFADLAPGALEARLADAFWPGDAAWPGPLDWLDFLFYPAAVPIARSAAPGPLAEAIRRIPCVVVVDIVAHSLGCRLALEVLKELRANGGPAIGRVCLMAAAVPLEYVGAAGPYGELLRSLQAANVELRVLHSTSDLVLTLAFDPGQAIAGEPTRGAFRLLGPGAHGCSGGRVARIRVVPAAGGAAARDRDPHGGGAARRRLLQIARRAGARLRPGGGWGTKRVSISPRLSGVARWPIRFTRFSHIDPVSFWKMSDGSGEPTYQ